MHKNTIIKLYYYCNIPLSILRTDMSLYMCIYCIINHYKYIVNNILPSHICMFYTSIYISWHKLLLSL